MDEDQIEKQTVALDATSIEEDGDSEAAPAATEVVAAGKEWLPHLKEALALLPKDDKLLNLGIYTVPRRLETSPNDDVICPLVVSIGPLHHGLPGLLAMHEQKVAYLSFIMHRENIANTSVETFNACCKSISRSNRFKIYAKNVRFGRNYHRLIEMLLIDGGFILELLIRCPFGDPYDKKDPIFKNKWVLPALRHDLLLLQNQIPFFILRTLYRTIFPPNEYDFYDLAHRFFATCLTNIHYPGGTKQFFCRGRLHFLDMVHQAYILPNDDDRDNTNLDLHQTVQIGDEKTPHRLTRCTQKLLAAGVKIESSPNTHLLQVTFKNGTLWIPPLAVSNQTWSILKNLVAFEQCVGIVALIPLLELLL